jgi:hypothetical protein
MCKNEQWHSHSRRHCGGERPNLVVKLWLPSSAALWYDTAVSHLAAAPCVALYAV